jgi:hypothetical protein
MQCYCPDLDPTFHIVRIRSDFSHCPDLDPTFQIVRIWIQFFKLSGSPILTISKFWTPFLQQEIFALTTSKMTINTSNIKFETKHQNSASQCTRFTSNHIPI